MTVIAGTGADDTFTPTPAQAAAGGLTFDGGAGLDTLDLSALAPVALTGSPGHFFVSVAGAPTFEALGVETVVGSGRGDDFHLQGDATQGLTIHGGAGADTFVEDVGVRDTLFGGDGGDSFFGLAQGGLYDGGAGDDLFSAGSAYVVGASPDATILGGAGEDTLAVGDGFVVDLAAGAAVGELDRQTLGTPRQSFRLSGVEDVQVQALHGASTIQGDAGDNILVATVVTRPGDPAPGSGAAALLYGGDGSDRLSAAGLSATLDGGAGDDTIDAFSVQGLRLSGGAGDDEIGVSGGTGVLVDAGDGADRVRIAGAGGDVVLGAGADRLVLLGASAGLTVEDFQPGDAGDVLEVQGAALIGADARDVFLTGFFRLLQEGADTLVQEDRDGSAGSAYGFQTVVTLKGAQASQFTTANFAGLAQTTHPQGAETPDHAAPTAVHLYAPQTVDVTQGDATASFGLFAQDAGSGVAAATVVFRQTQVEGGASFTVAFSDAADSFADGASFTTATFGASDHPGVYGVVEVDVTDHAGNTATFTGRQLAAAGLDATLTLVGRPPAEVAGTAAADALAGGAGDDRVLAGGGDDTVTASGGRDTLDGGAGSDTLAFSGFAHDYALAVTAGAGAASGGPEGGTDTLTSVETLTFLDGTLTFDPQSTAAQIVRLYDSFLGRAPDAAGFESYLRFVAAGHSFQDMADNAAASPEFHDATAALSDTDYIRYVYAHSLHREPDPGGLQNYLDALHSGALTRTSLIVQAAESPEHVALTAGLVAQGLWIPDEKVESLELLYDAAVRRQPDAYGLAGYSAEIASGTSYRQIANQMASSAEFQAAHAGQDDEQYIDSLYVAELGRHGEPAGLAAYTDQLAHGYTRGDVLYETAFSPEHQSHVLAVYDPLLG